MPVVRSTAVDDVRRSWSRVLWNGINPVLVKEHADMDRKITQQLRWRLEAFLKGLRKSISSWRAGYNYYGYHRCFFVGTIDICILILPQKTYHYLVITAWFMGVNDPGRSCKTLWSYSVFIDPDNIFICALA